MDDLMLILMWVGGIAAIMIVLILVENAVDGENRRG